MSKQSPGCRPSEVDGLLRGPRLFAQPAVQRRQRCVIVVSDTIFVRLLTHARFRDFTPKAICDTSQAIEVLLTLSCESREQVDDLVTRAVAASGSTHDKPEDYGFMHTHSFVDPDGHGWGLIHMNATPAQT